MRYNNLDELDKTMLCARWMVHQFERLGYNSIAKIFQLAIKDSEAWINSMVDNKKIDKETFEPIKEEEVKLLHNILVRYASISNPLLRNQLLDNMKEEAETIEIDKCSNG